MCGIGSRAEIDGGRHADLYRKGERCDVRSQALGGNIAPADCVRACVQKGANYALVVGDKVYTLDTKDEGVSAELNKLAWRQAKVTGTANGDTISVKSVTAATK